MVTAAAEVMTTEVVTADVMTDSDVRTVVVPEVVRVCPTGHVVTVMLVILVV